MIARAITALISQISSASKRLSDYQNADIQQFQNELYTATHALNWLWNDGLDMATDFFAGWADTLTIGVYGFINGNTYGTYINWNSTAFHYGQIVGTVHVFAIGAAAGAYPCQVGWAPSLVSAYNWLGSGIGMAQAGYHIYQGQATLWGVLALAPLAGRALGMTGVLGSGCFIAGTPVATGCRYDADAVRIA